MEQEESYTSMASFWDLDEMPVYGERRTCATGLFRPPDLAVAVYQDPLVGEGGSTLMSMVL